MILSIQGAGRVGKLLNRDGDPTPNSRLSVIALRRRYLLGASEVFRLGLVSVWIDHQHRDALDLNLPQHAGNAEILRLVRMLLADRYTPA